MVVLVAMAVLVAMVVLVHLSTTDTETVGTRFPIEHSIHRWSPGRLAMPSLELHKCRSQLLRT